MGAVRRSEGNLKISFSAGDNLIVVQFMPPIDSEDKHSICFPFAPPPSRRRSPSLRRYTGVIWGEKLREAVYNLLLDLMGSVTAYALPNVTCPLTVIKDPNFKH